MAVGHVASASSGSQASVASFDIGTLGTGARAGIVFVCIHNSATDIITGVTWNGSPMTLLYSATDTNTEPGVVKAYFLDNVTNGIITVSRTNNTVVTVGYAASLSAGAGRFLEVAQVKTVGGGGTVQTDANASESGTAASGEVAVDDGSPGSNSLRYAAYFSGASTPPAQGTNSTNLQVLDSSLYGSRFVRETSAGQGSRSVGAATGTTDDWAFVAVAVREGASVVGGSFTSDAIVKKTASGSLTANAVKQRLDQPGSFTADAVIKKIQTFAQNFYDTFTRTVTPGIGTSDSGHTYVLNEGDQGATENGFYTVPALQTATWLLPECRDRGQVQFDFLVPSDVTTDPFVEIDFDSPTRVHGGVFVTRQNGSTWMAGFAYPDYVIFFTPTPGWYTVKVRYDLVSEVAGLKVWRVGTNEPNWSATEMIVIPGTGQPHMALTGSSTASASIDNVSIDSGLFVDAVIRRTQAPAFTADAVLRRPDQSGSFTTDAVIQRTMTGGAAGGNGGLVPLLLASSLAAQAGFTIDAVIEVGATTVPGDFTTDAVLFRTQAGSATVDAVIRRPDQPGSFAVEAVVLRPQVIDIEASLVVSAAFELGSSATGERIAQSFTPTASGVLDSIRYRFYRVGNPTDDLITEIQSDDTNAPSGTVLAALETVAGSSLTNAWREVSLSLPVTSGTRYWIVARRSGVISGSDYYWWFGATTSVYAGGDYSRYGFSAWNINTSRDLSFAAYITTSGLTADAVIFRTQTGSATADAVLKRLDQPGSFSAGAVLRKTMAVGSGSETIAQDSFTGSAGDLASHTAEVGGSWFETYDDATDNSWRTSGSGRATLDHPVSTTVGTVVYAIEAMADGYVQANTNAAGQSLDQSGPVIRQKTGEGGTYYVAYGGTLYRSTGSILTSLGSTGGSGTWYRLQATGLSPTTLKVERRATQGALGTGWLLETTDNTALNQTASGYVGIHGYADNDFGFWSHDVDDFLAAAITTGPTLDAVVLRTQAGSLTANAVIFRTIAGSLTGDAVVLRTQTGSLTVDACIVITQPGSLTADAVIRRTISVSFTADAVLRRTQAASLTIDAAIATTVPGSLTVDAILRKTMPPASVTVDAVIQRTQSGSFTADAIVLVIQAASFTADAELQVGLVTVEDSFTADAIALRTQASVAPADAVLLRTQAESATADAITQRPISGSFSADAITQRAASGSFTQDAVLQVPRAASITADSILLRIQTASATADAIIFRTMTGLFTADAVVMPVFIVDAITLRTQVGSMTADAVVMPVLTADAVVLRVQSAALTVDAWIAGVGVFGFPADAVLLRPSNFTATFDAVLLRTISESLTANAVLFRTISASFVADAVIRQTTSAAFTADAVLSAESIGNFTANAVLNRTITGTFSTDAVIRATISATYTADAVQKKTQSASFTGDSTLLAGRTGGLTSDAVLLSPQAGAFTADAWVQGAGVFGFTADAVLKTTNSASISADAIVRLSSSASVTVDAAIQRVVTSSITADAVLYRTLDASYNADAVLRSTSSASFTADAYISAAIGGSFTADAITFRTMLGSFGSDSVFEQTIQGQLDAEAILRVVHSDVLLADAALVRTAVLTVTVDAIIFNPNALAFTANAWIKTLHPQVISAELSASTISATISTTTISAAMDVATISAEITGEL